MKLVLTRRSQVRLVVLVLLLLGAGVYRIRDSRRVDVTALPHDAAGPVLRIMIVGDPNDARIAPAREAIAHWNQEFVRLGRRVHFDSAGVSSASIPDEALRAASGEATFGRGAATTRLLASISEVPADIVIALSRTDLISFGVSWRAGSRGVVALRRSDIPPLSLPNTVRNVIAHELG